MIEARLPLLLRWTAPGPEFVRLAIPGREGFHTGGPFLSPDGNEVWKGLDGRPLPDVPFHLPTNEETVLHLMADTSGFPANWRVEVANGRRWLVRKVAPVVPETYSPQWLTLDQVLHVEQALRSLNAKRWRLGDHLRVAIDPDTEEPFILDLSAAVLGGGPEAPRISQANDAALFERWASEVAGFGGLVLFRRDARQVVSGMAWINGPYGKTHRWVYASRTRPLERSWASIPDAVYLDADWNKTGVWTWVVVPVPLGEEVAGRYQLQYGHGPIPYE